MTSECRCGKPTKDAAYFCEDCANELHKALGDVPWLDEELEVTISGQRGVDYRTMGAQGGSEPPSPVHWGASEARVHLKALLVSWALFCESEGIRHQSHHDGLPEDNLTALSRWLIWRIDGLALHDIGPDAVDEITSGVDHCHRLIDRPPDLQYLGRCTETDMCPGLLYAKPGGALAICTECERSAEASKIRDQLLAELEDRLCTAAEIARLSTYLGLKAGREQVRNRINQWHKRERIVSESMFEDAPAFRFGTIYEMLVASEYGRKSA